MNPNHSHYLSGGPNLNLLDNMLMAAGFQATDQPKHAIVPQYNYSHEVAANMHMHQAMNLVQQQLPTVTASDPVHVIVYQNEAQQQHQQQPISYKIPHGGFVVNEPASEQASQQQYSASAGRSISTMASHLSSVTRSPAERKKDIVAQAMQEQKIFEDSLPKTEVKQEPGLPAVPSRSGGSKARSKPNITASKSNAATKTNTATSKQNIKPNQQRLPTSYQQPHQLGCRSKDSPSLSLMEEEDDGLTCRLCLASYWYKKEMHEHLKSVHSIADPIKYEKEEREKKLRRQREENQRANLAKKQRDHKLNAMRKKSGTIKLTSPGARASQSPGARPSFQYRDGAFICDLCKESFSDGNDMVSHWKSHVKKQQSENKTSGGGGDVKPGKGRGRGRGRPPLKREYRSDSEDEKPFMKKRPYKSHRGPKPSKNDRGKPRWTAYLLWSTRKRRDVVVDHPDWTFAQIAKWISDEWKKIDAFEKDELQKEAEEMNELGIRKLPRDDEGIDPERDTTDDDSDFEEGYRKKNKSLMMKIKKEATASGDAEETFDVSDESDWEPEAELNVGKRESRSGRQRKRPSFFQEFESQENNLDNILQEFEETQAKEFGKPREPKPAKVPSERKPRKKKPKEPTAEVVEEEVETEVLRSGRRRKVRRLLNSYMDEDEDDVHAKGASSDDDDFEPPPEEEVEKIEENDDQIEESDEVDEFDDDDEEDYDDIGPKRDHALPIKKRGRPKKILTDAEIEEATRAALGTIPSVPVIEITPVPRVAKDGDTGEKEKEAASKDGVATNATENSINHKEAGDANKEEKKITNHADAAAEKDASNVSTNKTKEPEPFRPFFVNESLEEEQEKGGKEPLAEDPLNPTEKNPLDMEVETATGTVGRNKSAQINEEEEALLATVSCDVNTPAAPLGVISNEKLPDGVGQQHNSVNSDVMKKATVMSEEDLLTGPAHNLDDSQYKTDYVDPNLDDIFK